MSTATERAAGRLRDAMRRQAEADRAARERVQCIGTNRYLVRSSRFPDVFYNVQLNNHVGVCDCPGFPAASSKGHPCQHVRAALAFEVTQ